MSCYSLSHDNNYKNNCSSYNDDVCFVGYALNAKKLRKSIKVNNNNNDNVELSPVGSTGSYIHSGCGGISSSSCSSIGMASTVFHNTINHNTATTTATTTTTSSSTSTTPKKDNNKSKFHEWHGGGLADILIANNNYDRDTNDNTLSLSLSSSCLRDNDNNNNNNNLVKFIHWDYEIPLERQPIVHVIIHKLTEDIDKNDYESKQKLLALELYLKKYPSTVIIDSIDSVRKVISRSRTCSYLHQIQLNLQHHQCPFTQPNFVIVDDDDYMTNDYILTLLESSQLEFPVICKPLEACGTPKSHNMVVLVSPKDLYMLSKPCIIQQYYNHNEKFFKVYVIDNDVMVYERSSLPNLHLHDNHHILKSVAFDSRQDYPTIKDFICADINHIHHNQYQQHHDYIEMEQKCKVHDSIHSESSSGSFEIATVDMEQKNNIGRKFSPTQKGKKSRFNPTFNPALNSTSQSNYCNVVKLPVAYDRFRETAEVIKQEFGLSLFGFDVIVPINDNVDDNGVEDYVDGHADGYSSSSSNISCSSQDPTIMVIDINYFPSYKEVIDFPSRLRRFLRSKANMQPIIKSDEYNNGCIEYMIDSNEVKLSAQ